MAQLDFTLSIAHLYPDLLNIYGDLGNVVTLQKRAQWRNINIKTTEIKTGQTVKPEQFDIYFIGGGQDIQQITASKELLKNKNALKEAMETDAVILAVCGGYQLLGHCYQPYDSDKLDGIGLLDCYTVAGKNRFIGNVRGNCSFIEPSSVVGFENHSGLTYLQGETKPLLTIEKGKGNNGEDKTEGARFKNVFGTYLHGPILPKNPAFADYLISLALKRKYKCEIPLNEINDEIENLAHKACMNIAK